MSSVQPRPASMRGLVGRVSPEYTSDQPSAWWITRPQESAQWCTGTAWARVRFSGAIAWPAGEGFTELGEVMGLAGFGGLARLGRFEGGFRRFGKVDEGVSPPMGCGG